MTHHPIDDYKAPPNYLKTEQTKRLHEGLGEQAWNYLEAMELLDEIQEILERLGSQNVSGQHDMIVQAIGKVKRIIETVRVRELLEGK